MHFPSFCRPVLLAVALVHGSGGAFARDLRDISIGIASTSISGGGARIANEMGLFEKQGLRARVIPMESGSVATAALISGSVDFASGGGSEVVVAQAKGQDIVTVAPLYGEFGLVLVLAKSVADELGVLPDAPVEDRLKALDGLIIATPAASSTSTFALKPATEAVGATPRLSYMGFPVMNAALETGAIQGYMASAPFYAIPVIGGSGVIWISGQKGEFPDANTPANYSVLNTTRAFATAEPEVIEKVRAVFADFSRIAREEPDQLEAAITRLFPDLDPKTLDLLIETEALGFQTTPLTRADLAHEIEFVRSTGQVQGVGDLDPAKLLLE